MLRGRHAVLRCCAVVLFLTLFGVGQAYCQATWDGPTGAFLNPVAMTLGEGKAQFSMHFLDLQPMGTLTTAGVTYGGGPDWEVGLTRAVLSVEGTAETDILHAKWIALPAKDDWPTVALGGVVRSTHGGDTTTDWYVAATRILPTKAPLILSATVRNTNGAGSGLFGKTADREWEFGAFVGVMASKTLCVGVEYWGQPEGKDWKDVCARWHVKEDTFIDAGVAYLNDDLDNQVAVALTHQW